MHAESIKTTQRPVGVYRGTASLSPGFSRVRLKHCDQLANFRRQTEFTTSFFGASVEAPPKRPSKDLNDGGWPLIGGGNPPGFLNKCLELRLEGHSSPALRTREVKASGQFAVPIPARDKSLNSSVSSA